MFHFIPTCTWCLFVFSLGLDSQHAEKDVATSFLKLLLQKVKREKFPSCTKRLWILMGNIMWVWVNMDCWFLKKMFCLIHQWPLQWERNDSPVESVADTLSIFQTNPNMHPNKVACLEQTSPKFLRPPRVHFDPVHVEWMVSRSYDLGNPCISMWYIRTYSYTYYIIPPIWKKSEYPKQHITSRSLDEGRYTDIYIWAIYNIILFMLLKGSINPLAIQLYPEAGQYGSQSVGESGRWGASRFFPLGIWGWSIHQLFGVPRVPGFWPITWNRDQPWSTNVNLDSVVWWDGNTSSCLKAILPNITKYIQILGKQKT